MFIMSSLSNRINAIIIKQKDRLWYPARVIAQTVNVSVGVPHQSWLIFCRGRFIFNMSLSRKCNFKSALALTQEQPVLKGSNLIIR